MIKNIVLIVTLVTFILGVLGECSIKNFEQDPLPWGTRNCTTNDNCNYPNGQCTNLTCVCENKFGKPDCSYARKQSQVAGGLNIGLPFAGVAGVGNLYIRRMPQGIAQIVLSIIGIIFLCGGCCVGGCILCGGSCKMSCDGCIPVTIGILFILLITGLILAGLGVFIWSIIDGANMLSCTLRDGFGYALSFQ